MTDRTLQQSLNDCLVRHAGNSALEVDDRRFTYAELDQQSRAGAAAVASANTTSPFVGIFAYRSTVAYLGILSTLRAGKAYLPVSHKFPPERLFEIFRMSECDTLFLGRELIDHFREFLGGFDDRLPALRVIYLPEEAESMEPLAADFPRHRFVLTGDGMSDEPNDFPQASLDDFAYMLFTSGSTGKPKGIAITHENVASYLAFFLSRYEFRPDDRFTQSFDLTFDYSVHDLFCCWLSGACLCVIPPAALIAPAKFIEKKQITVWFSVPSLAMTMDRIHLLKPGRFESIRLSFFGGEAVSEKIITAWRAAAPRSIAHNVYGPTEATINITHYRWDPDRSPDECVHGGVPLGLAFDTQEIRVVDEAGRSVPPGTKGQLVVSGSQVARGYYKNPEKTAEAFRTLPDDPRRIWYHTGDLVSRDENGLIRYFGRIDFQVQVCGHRVELAEIESLLREAGETESAVALPWPYEPETGRADKIVAVLGGITDLDGRAEAIDRLCRARLPDYAVPWKTVSLAEFPLNINGKIDCRAIADALKKEIP